jgi:hypothetical protein
MPKYRGIVKHMTSGEGGKSGRAGSKPRPQCGGEAGKRATCESHIQGIISYSGASKTADTDFWISGLYVEIPYFYKPTFDLEAGTLHTF